MKKNKNYLLAFTLPIVIFLIFIIINQNFKIYDNVIINDLRTQYTSLLMYLKNILMGNDSIFYSFTKGIGGNMISTIAYYLLSPFNLLVIFFENINISIFLGILLRFCFSSFTMFYFLKNKYQKDNIGTLIFSLIYAFSGYMINYYFNIMWIDILIILPIIIKKVDDLIDNKKTRLLPILLFISLIINFYISYMLYIFLIIYFINQVLLKYDLKKNRDIIKKISKEFIVNIIISILLSAFLLLPTVLDMKNNMFRYSFNKDIFSLNYSSIPMIISKLYVGAFDISTIFSHEQANLYITLFGVILIIKYFFNNRISKKEKILSFSVILIFVFSIAFEFLNLIWHGFSFPNGYNYRFSFLFIFYLVDIMYKQYLNNYELNTKKTTFICLLFIIISLLLRGLFGYLNDIKIIISSLLFITYIILLNFNSTKTNIILYILIFIEINLNFNLCFITADKITYYDNNVSYYKDELCDELNELSGNYRMSLQNFISYDDSIYCGIKDLPISLTTNNKLYYEFMNNMGYSVTYSTIADNYVPQPFIQSILGVKYTLRINANFELYYNIIDVEKKEYEDFNLYLYKHTNQNALSIGYVVNNTQLEYTNNPFENQNMLAKEMSGLDLDVFEPVKLTKVSEYTYKYNVSGYYYIYNYFPVPINSEEYISYVINDYKIKLGPFNKGVIMLDNGEEKEAIMRIAIDDRKYRKYIDPIVYVFNEDNYNKVIQKITQGQLKVTKFNKNKLKGEIYLDEDKILMLSIPYEKGWNIKVNGEKVKYSKAYDTFISLELEEGSNKIEMTFIPPGLKLGIIISFIGVFIYYGKEKSNITK